MCKFCLFQPAPTNAKPTAMCKQPAPGDVCRAMFNRGQGVEKQEWSSGLFNCFADCPTCEYTLGGTPNSEPSDSAASTGRLLHF